MTEPAAPPEPIPSDTKPEETASPPGDEAKGAIVPKLTDTIMGGLPVILPPLDVPPPPPAPPLPIAAPPVAAPPAPHVEPAPASTVFLVVVTVVSLAADLVTKGWAKATLAGFDNKLHGQRRIEVWKPHFGFIFAQNPGGAWSFLRSLPDTLRRPFFLVVSAAAIVFIVSIYQKVHRDQTAMKWGLPLALGGAMGNLVDRIRYGWVIDFIDFSMKWGGREHHWPTFNVADIAIVVGVVLMGLDMTRARRHPHHFGGDENHLGSAALPPPA